ncbi:hypothetical protein PIB30_078080 [Stylosanthes scabra]|uniref:Uncharacterized protein n=1 Tax=Stylosanthes scabra TaxID=79078 RepID=A0ABU6YRC5_9FABA|nr:hypothetical protein [Stylosanthes scabra]
MDLRLQSQNWEAKVGEILVIEFVEAVRDAVILVLVLEKVEGVIGCARDLELREVLVVELKLDKTSEILVEFVEAGRT